MLLKFQVQFLSKTHSQDQDRTPWPGPKPIPKAFLGAPWAMDFSWDGFWPLEIKKPMLVGMMSTVVENRQGAASRAASNRPCARGVAYVQYVQYCMYKCMMYVQYMCVS